VGVWPKIWEALHFQFELSFFFFRIDESLVTRNTTLPEFEFVQVTSRSCIKMLSRMSKSLVTYTMAAALFRLYSNRNNLMLFRFSK
jgi:hypothetical protein